MDVWREREREGGIPGGGCAQVSVDMCVNLQLSESAPVLLMHACAQVHQRKFHECVLLLHVAVQLFFLCLYGHS